ncbi:MFS transporter [Nocardia sp. NPDC049707]|uniref:MFS transporter n=1 Tax=Nocardia sp. NPDC049707 TaxID=3154735 RepID=UPI0034458765
MSRPAIYTHRDFMLLWSGNATSVAGFHCVRIAYPLLALSITESAALAGWVGFAISAPSLIFQLPAGIAADYSDRRRILLGCQLIGLVAACAAALVVVFRLPNPGPVLVATAFVEGTIFVFFNVVELAAIRDIVDVEQRPAAFSFFEAEQPIGLVVGRAVGAAIYAVARWLPFVVNAVSYVCCLATLWAIRGRFAQRSAPRQQTNDASRWRVRDGARIVWTEPLLRASTMISGASNVVIQVAILLTILRIERSGRPVWTVGIVLGAAGVGGVLGSFAASWLTARFGSLRIYRGTLWAWTVLLLPIAASSNPLVLGIAWFGVGGVGTVVNVAMTIYKVNVVPEDTLGRTFGTVAMANGGAVALGSLLAGYLLSVFGTTTTGWALVGVMLIAAVVGSCVGNPAQRLTAPLH